MLYSGGFTTLDEISGGTLNAGIVTARRFIRNNWLYVNAAPLTVTVAGGVVATLGTMVAHVDDLIWISCRLTLTKGVSAGVLGLQIEESTLGAGLGFGPAGQMRPLTNVSLGANAVQSFTLDAMCKCYIENNYVLQLSGSSTGSTSAIAAGALACGVIVLGY
jgi:hypothetical protein